MNNYVVYMHINRANGKRYVGITCRNPVKRWQNGRGYFRNKHFSDAIEKYGWDSFDHLIIRSELTKEQACELERQLIAEYQTQDKEKGYNITDGGENFTHSEISKQLMSQRRKGKGQHVFSEEHKRRIKEHHAGGNEKKKVRCLDTGKVYDSINDASRDTGINKKGISGCCRHVPNYNTAGGMRWAFEVI